MKLNVAVFFGGESVEHEVSIISAHQAMEAMDQNKYNVIPVYVAKDRRLYCSDQLKEMKNFKDLDALKKQCTQITIVSEDNKVVMKPVKAKQANSPARTNRRARCARRPGWCHRLGGSRSSGRAAPVYGCGRGSSGWPDAGASTVLPPRR